jgi:hypothetical protein
VSYTLQYINHEENVTKAVTDFTKQKRVKSG